MIAVGIITFAAGTIIGINIGVYMQKKMRGM